MRFNESATNYLSGTRWRAAAAAAKTAVQQDTEQQQQWQQHSVRLNVVYLVCHKYVDYTYTPFSIKHQVLEILGCETTHSAKQKRGENSDTNEKREHSGDRTIDLIYMRRCCCPAVEYYYWGCYSCYCSSLAAWLLRGCPCCTHIRCGWVHADIMRQGSTANVSGIVMDTGRIFQTEIIGIVRAYYEYW